MPFADGLFAIDHDEIKKCNEWYSNIDVLSELNRIKEWLSNTQNKLPPKADALQFVRGWLKGENRKAEYRSPPQHTPTYTHEKSHDAEEFFRAAVEKSMGMIFNEGEAE